MSWWGLNSFEKVLKAFLKCVPPTKEGIPSSNRIQPLPKDRPTFFRTVIEVPVGTIPTKAVPMGRVLQAAAEQ